MDTINILKIYSKAEKVLNSCKNETHLNSALTYIHLSYRRTEDFLGYNKLLRMYHKLYDVISLNEETEDN